MKLSIDTAAISDKLLLGAFLLLALGSWWLRQLWEDTDDYNRGQTQIPDYWIDRLAARTVDERGQLRRLLIAERMRHFPADDSFELDNPKIDFLEPPDPPWRVQAQAGRLTAGGDLIVLAGLVTVDREGGAGTLPIHLVTNDLRVQPKEHYAETDQPVDMQSGSSRVQSRGAKIWLKRPIRVKLLADVKAHYEVAK